MDGSPLPWPVADIEGMILALYEPGRLGDVGRIQETLHEMQKSPQGWQLAQILMSSSDASIKFFGASTMIINTSLSDDEAAVLLESLVGKLMLSLGQGSAHIGTRKICAALVTYFIQFPSLWPEPIPHLVFCLREGRYVRPGESIQVPNLQGVVSSLDEATANAVLWFTTTLIEEAGKTDPKALRFLPVHENIAQMSAPVLAVLSHCLDQKSPLRLRDESLACLNSWVTYSMRSSTTGGSLVTALRSLVGPAVECLAEETLFDAAASFLAETLSSFPGFFSSEHFNLLLSVFETPWTDGLLNRVLCGDTEFNTFQFGMLLLAFGEATIADLMTDPGPRSQAFLRKLSALIAAEGWPAVEDRLFVPTIEFWSTFVETLTEKAVEDESDDEASAKADRPPTPPWLHLGLSNIMLVAESCWRRIRFPPPSVFSAWDSAEKTSFVEARKDVADLLLAVFAVGPSIVAHYVNLVLEAIAASAWTELEAAIYCLTALSDCISEDDTYDADFYKIFSSSLFQILETDSQAIPQRARQTCLSLIERYNAYFKRHTEHLPLALRLLFNAVVHTALAMPSAKAIYTLCSSSRSILAPDAASFLDHYASLSSTTAFDILVEERIVGGIACVVQAIQGQERQAAFERLLNLTNHQFRSSVRPGVVYLAKGTKEQGWEPTKELWQPSVAEADAAHQLALRALRNMTSIAKGMQSPADHLVDLDGSEGDHGHDNIPDRSTAMVLADLTAARDHFIDSSEVTDAICNVFRAGFSEREPGPFVFPAAAVAEFLSAYTAQSPRIGTVVATACSFMSSLSHRPDPDANRHLGRLVLWAIGLLQSLASPEDDTDLSQHGIDFVSRVLSKRPAVFLQGCPATAQEAFLGFTLKVLGGTEPLPRASAADLWATLIALRPVDQELRVAVDAVLNHLGLYFTQCLIKNIGGDASRSELDRLCEPLKRLVSSRPDARRWLEETVMGPAFPSARPSREEKALFVKKIIAARGSRQTNQIVREFWLVCRGLTAAYSA